MCGIVGVWDKTGNTTKGCVQEMTATLAHRGPDDIGDFHDVSAGVFLGHRRLSLIDLSPGGHQPMHIDGCTITYNGEIYNYQDIREELAAEGVVCTSNSDTEVLLRAWILWGPAAVEKFRGMFAFVIWDANAQKLFICRDRVGVKPMYFYHRNNLFACASELKALLVHPSIKKEIDHEALPLFLQLGYVPAPYSIFKHIAKLEQGSYLVIDDSMNLTMHRYWRIDDYYKTAQKEVHREDDVLDTLEKKLKESFQLHMIADVPVGVFLSGGIDSSLVTALLKKSGHDNLKTFTIGFAENTHDESKYAKAVAKHLGTEHYELRCTAKEAKEIILKLPEMYDEPFADASAIPTYLLSKFAKGKVTAALSADGGDELFGGYTRYRSGQHIFTTFKKLPAGLGPLIALSVQGAMLLARLGLIHPNRVHKFRKAHLYYTHRHSIAESYATQNSYFSNSEIAKLLKQPQTTFLSDMYNKLFPAAITHHIRKLQHIDFHTYLPDDILAKVDRATMAVSLEGREPLLDHRIIEYTATLPDSLMHKEAGNKYLLRQLLYRYIPRELVDRPKQGFGVPLNEWLKGDLAWLLEKYLDKEALEKQDIFNYESVEKERQDFLRGAQPYNRIWNIIIFQMWYNNVCLKI